MAVCTVNVKRIVLRRPGGSIARSPKASRRARMVAPKYINQNLIFVACSSMVKQVPWIGRKAVVCAAAPSSSSQGPPEKDVQAVVTYFGATSLQWGLMMGALGGLQLFTDALATSDAPDWSAKAVVVLFFGTMSIRSRIFSPLDNSRPTIEKDGKTMNVMDERIRPSWMPPALAFPIIWSTIGLLRTLSSVSVWEACDRNLVVLPLALMMLHLAIGDTWNTINNVERRMGTAVAGVAFVLLSAIVVDSSYFNAATTAGLLLAPSVVWLSVASVLVYTINQLNGPEPLFPMKKM